MIWVNFKIHLQTFGKGAVRLARVCQEVRRATGAPIIPVVSALDFWRVKREVGGEVWLQHLDLFFEGAKTGWISPLAAVALGASGSFLNHAEHKIPPGKVRQILAYLKKERWQRFWYQQVKKTLPPKSFSAFKTQLTNFKLMICFRSQGQVRGWVKRLRPRPDFVAWEPTHLIGAQQSIGKEELATLEKIKAMLPGWQIVVGAGIRSRQDVVRLVQAGVAGIIVSSPVVCAPNPKKVLLEFASAFVSCEKGNSLLSLKQQ